MDAKLVAWARRVKARRGAVAPPPLWLFTDPLAHPDLPATVARLPRGLCGVVFRHDAVTDRDALARAVARICRVRRLTLSVAGDWRLAAALRAGCHLRDGFRPRHAPRWARLATASAHDRADALRAMRAGAALILVSPAFPTASHPNAPALGVLGWLRVTSGLGGRAAALGGMSGTTARRLPHGKVAAVGAISALSRMG